MTLSFICFFLSAGVLCLYIGAEMLVWFASKLAISFGLSSMMTGLTVVALCTSTPELVSSVMAELGGESNMALGNVVGSNIANIGLILGLLALFKPMKIGVNIRKFEAPFGIVLACFLWLAMLTGRISRGVGVVFLITQVLYLAWHVHQAKKKNRENGHVGDSWGKKLYFVIFVILGALITVGGGYLFIDGAIHLAHHFEISGRIIGLTIVAVGSSLPEFAASFIALVRKNPDIAIGNIFGSNIINILLVLGVVSLINPLSFSPSFITLDMPVLIGISLLVWLLTFFNHRLNRFSGVVLTLAYAGYLYLII